MKIRNLALRENLTRITFSLRESDAQMLNHNVEYVSEELDQEVPTSDVVGATLKTFLEDDRRFQSWLRKQGKRAEKAPKVEEGKPEPKADTKPATTGVTQQSPGQSQPSQPHRPFGA